jgi:GTP cyclohydrolase I
MTHPAITKFPTPVLKEKLNLSSDEKKRLIAEKMGEILEILGLDLHDASLAETPKRVAEMYVDEIFWGLDPTHFPEVVMQRQECERSEMVLIKNISLISFCEHHFVPMVGKAHVAYIPKDQVIGLSKVNRIVKYFAKRPQLQERLTAQIADSLSIVLQSEDVAVYTTARHHCVSARGVEDEGSETDIHVLRGVFLHDDAQRREFFSNIHH